MRAIPIFLIVFLFLKLGCNDGDQNNGDQTNCIVDTSSEVNSEYEEIVPDTFDITVLDNSLALPTRIKISPDRSFIFIAQLEGNVTLFVRERCNWIKQEELFFDLGDLNVEGERGLTGLFFGANFEPDSSDPVNRDIFLTYQSFDGQGFRNRIKRVTFAREGDTFIGTNETLIYEGPQPSAPAHQIQDGIGFIYQGAPHILVGIGDGFAPQDALDISKEGHGKLLLMQSDGSDPLGPRPFPTAPKIQAIGIRNVYGIAMIPEKIDPRRRIIGVENGNSFQDRIWLLEVVDFGLEVNGQVSFGYTGSDQDLGWTSVPDINSPRNAKPEGVLALLSPIVSPNSVSFHPGGGIIPTSGNNNVSFLIVYFGLTFSTGNAPGKQVVLAVIDNLDTQPSITLTPLIQRKEAVEDLVGNPLPLAVDEETGEFFFADVVAGTLYRVSPL